MKLLKEHVEWDYFDKYSDIIYKYMPDRGEGETEAAQAVTAVNKLIYKWYNDGDVFDNSYYLEGWLNDLSSYANWLYKYAPKTDLILGTIRDCYNDSDYEDLLQELADQVLNEKYLAPMAENPAVGSIYDQKGPFSFTEYEEEEEEEEDDYNDDWYDESLKRKSPLKERIGSGEKKCLMIGPWEDSARILTPKDAADQLRAMASEIENTNDYLWLKDLCYVITPFIDGENHLNRLEKSFDTLSKEYDRFINNTDVDSLLTKDEE